MHPVNEQLNQPGGLAERLFRMRKAVAGLTGDKLAADLHWPRSKVSKIENGRQMPSAEDIRAWTQACGRPEEADELAALLADVQSVHRRWRRRIRQGQAAIQEDMDRRTRQAKRVRNAEVAVIPGLLQTAGYARAIATQIAAAYGVSDIDAGVDARMRRAEILYDRDKTFEFVITEAALRLPPCPPQVMLGQLDRLMTVTNLDNVTLGIIPFGNELQMTPLNGFLMLDEAAIVETYHEEDPNLSEEDAAAHARIFDLLMAEAVTGENARHLIAAAAADLREEAR